jgi:hypothetical protein
MKYPRLTALGMGGSIWLTIIGACSPGNPAATEPGAMTPMGSPSGGNTGSGGNTASSGSGGSAGGSGSGGGGGLAGTPAPPSATGGGSGSGGAPTTPDDAAAPPAPPAAGWWDAKWKNREKVTITDAALKETLTDFQVAVKLSPATFDFKNAKPAGEDLRFVSADGQVLNHQIDSWDPAGALIWLRVPKLDGNPITVWLYHGNPDAAAPEEAAVTATWPPPYQGVWHLSGDGKDATANRFDGAMMVGGSFTDAQYGKGLLLDGSKREHITLKADIKILAGATGCTFSAWIKPTKIENTINGMIIMTLGKWFNNNHNSYTDFNVNAAGQMISHIDPGTNQAASGYARILSDAGFIKADEWAWVTYVIDLATDQEFFFKNGQLISTKKPPNGKFSAASFIDMVSSRVVIGAEEDVVSHWWTGSMDELRIEKGLRTPAWIAAQYRAMTTADYVTVSADK